jgi:hypothetical protein
MIWICPALAVHTHAQEGVIRCHLTPVPWLMRIVATCGVSFTARDRLPSETHLY